MKVVTSLNQNTTLEKIKAESAHLRDVYFGEIPEALELLYSLEEKLRLERVEDQALLNAYRAILAELRLSLFSNFPVERALKFFEYYFLKAVVKDARGEISFYNNLKAFFGQVNVDDRNVLVEKTRHAIAKSEEILGSKPLIIKGQKLKPTFANWLKDYILIVGTGQKNIQRVYDYLRESQNVKNLTLLERKILSRALRYYEVLKFKFGQLGALQNMSLGDFGFSIDEIAKIEEDIFLLNKPERGYSPPRPLSPAPSKPASLPPPPIKKTVAALSASAPKIKPAPQVLAGLPKTAPGRPIVPRRVVPKVKPLPKKIISPAPAPFQAKPVVKKNVPKRMVTAEKLTTLETSADLEKVDVNFFRALAKTDQERLQKFLDLVASLKSKTTAESLRLSWQKSPLYELYLIVGRESMNTDLAVSAVSKKMFEQGKPYLSEREFEMVAEISSKF